MSGPKHLWSGDWERESGRIEEHTAARPRPRDPSPPPPRQRRRPYKAVLIALVAVLVIVGGAIALNSGGRSRSPSTTAATVPAAPVPIPQLTQTTPTTPAVTTPFHPVLWLGMEIATVAPGAAVVETVAPGSQGDVAGLEPGDSIFEINNHPISSAGDIADAIRGMPAGSRVVLRIANGSTLSQVTITLGAPPTNYP